MSEQQSDASTDSSETTQEDSRNEESQSSQVEASEPGDVGDDKLPDDLKPTEDNPLARHPGQTGDDGDKIGADVEGTDAANPSANMTYGSDENASNGPGGSEERTG